MELKVQKWFNWNKLDGSVIHLYDEASGGYRPATPSDFAGGGGGGGGGGGDASAANQTTQIGQLNNIIGKLGSGIAVSGISIDTINVNLDQVEALIGVSNTNTENIDSTLSEFFNETDAKLFLSMPATGVPSTNNATIASGVSTTVFAASSTRKYFVYQNNSNVDHYLNFGGAATSGNGIKVAAGGSYENPSHWYPRTNITAIAYGSGAFFTAKEA